MSDSQDTSSLMSQLGKFQDTSGKLPPIADWNPELSGTMDMVIRKDGSWYHEGDIIKREKLARLFSSILKKEGQDYFLVTPVEKWLITVQDMPFTIVLADIKLNNKKQEITLMSNMGDELTLDQEHKLEYSEGELPFVEVRSGLYARLNRNVYYQLAELAVETKQSGYIIKSGGAEHRIG